MSLPEPPPGINLQESQQNTIVISIFSTWALAILVVGLRFISRHISKVGLWLDDWFIIPPMVLQTIHCFMAGVWMINYGVGKHIWVSPPGALTVFFQGIFIGEFLYVGIVCFAKFSILAMYWRLFKAEYYVRIAIYVLAIIVACWAFGVILTSCLQCMPLRAFWDKSIIQAKCSVNSRGFFIGNAIPNIVTDAALLCVPIRVIWGLNLRTSQKIMLSLIFLMGAFATATSIVRLVYLMTVDLTAVDVTWTFRQIQIWTPIEMNMVIISACLPCLRPIFSKYLPFGSSSNEHLGANNWSRRRAIARRGEGIQGQTDLMFNSLLDEPAYNPGEVTTSTVSSMPAVYTMKSLSARNDGVEMVWRA